MLGDWVAVNRLAFETLDARIAAAHGNISVAIAHWKVAADAQDHLDYHEPPMWYYPVRESLGAALLRDGQFLEAERVFRTDLELNRRNPRSLFGLWKVLQAEHRDTEAGWVRSSFVETWSRDATTLRLADF